jgi:hypothetical protein
MLLSQKPDAKTPALGKLTVKGRIVSSRILSEGNIGTVTAGAIIDSSCFAGVTAITDVNAADGVLDLPSAEESNFDETATIKNITIKGIKTEAYPYYINSNIAAANILSVSLAYPEYGNGGVVFGITAGYIKSLKIKDETGTRSWKIIDESNKAPILSGDAQIRLY